MAEIPLSKHRDGTIRLSPLFAFAPMRVAKEGIVRSTRWAMMHQGGRDHLPDWKLICTALTPIRMGKEAGASPEIEQ